MDSFTENILERARQRQKKLIENDSSTLMAEIELNSDNNITGEHLRALPNNCKQNMKLSDADVDNFKKHTEKKKENHIFVNNFEALEESEGYAKPASLSSNKVNSINGELVKKDLGNSDQNKKLKRNCKGLGGLANLVRDMNEWEDDLSKSNRTNAEEKLASQKKWKPSASGSSVLNVRLPDNCSNTSRPPKIKYQAPKPPVLNSPIKCNSSFMEDTPKQLSLDPAVVEILNNENIKTAEIKLSKKVICPDQNHIIQEESELETAVVNEQPLKPLVPSQKNNIKGSAVAHKAAMFEAACSPNKNNKDPALLSLPERKALFEKNKSKPLIPKAPISLAPLSSKCAPSEKTACVLSNKNERFPSARPPIRKNDIGEQSYKIPEGQSGGIASKMAALFENKSTISQLQIEKDIREQRQREMDILLNRFPCSKNAHNSQPDANCEAVIEKENTREIGENESVEKIGNKRKSNDKISKKGDSPNVVASLEDIKRIKVASVKPGKLYPCLSDIEAMTETETENNTASTSPNNSSLEDSYLGSESEEADTSFGRGVLKTICKDQASKKRLIYDESTESDLSDILDDSNEYLDEAINYKASDESGPTPPKQNRSISPVNNVPQASHSFQFKNFSPRKELIQYNVSDDAKIVQEIESLETVNQLPTHVVDGDTVLPLTHTVSFYRRHQTEVLKTPIRKIIRNPIIEEPLNCGKIPIDEETEVREKIQQLLEYITKQQAIISQTSQALNLCYAAPEFTGSTEHVEAEKVLLLATHRRSAAQMEIERLSVLKTLHQETSETLNVPLEKGSLTISNIVLPLKRDYVRALNATGGKGHHVVCLVKCAEQVQMSHLVSTVATNSRNENLELSIPGSIHLKDIYSNFTIQFEVYCLQAQEEVIPHEVKYHINKKVNKLTPKKYKPESCLIKPPKESPGGSQMVRSPTFALMGYVVFSIQAMNRKSWTLNNAPSMSPLEGVVEMRVSCELSLSVEHRGFLTMFEDISGFGAWHRRWCLLKNNILCYWKYPEEEKKKASIGSIDLSACIAHQIGPVRRDICARLNTILIETKRPAEPHDKNSLVMECKGELTIIRHLLSADTKEEKNEWCSMFNKAVMTMKLNKNIK